MTTTTDALKAEVLAALAEHAGEQHMGMDCDCDLCDRRRALLARIESEQEQTR